MTKEQLAKNYAEWKSSSDVFREAHIQDFIAGYDKASEWISVDDRPLFVTTNLGWECTEDGNKDFIAAVPYNDSRYPGEEKWWIHHCVVEDGIGLCVVGDDGDYNEPAGWQLKDVTHWMPIPEPPKIK